MGRLIEEPAFREKRHLFKDREEAGERLADKMMEYQGSDSLVLAIPSGGVPVGLTIANRRGLPFDVVVVRKLQIPYEPEAGFGALGPDGGVVLNEELLSRIKLSKEEIDRQREKSLAVIRKRSELFRAGRPFPPVEKRQVIIVDDGLASGYTMLAVVEYIRGQDPSRVITAVPTGSHRTVQALLPQVDELVCLNIRSGASFAVADAYRHWYDLEDEEVLSLLQGYRRLPAL